MCLSLNEVLGSGARRISRFRQLSLKQAFQIYGELAHIDPHPTPHLRLEQQRYTDRDFPVYALELSFSREEGAPASRKSGSNMPRVRFCRYLQKWMNPIQPPESVRRKQSGMVVYCPILMDY